MTEIFLTIAIVLLCLLLVKSAGWAIKSLLFISRFFNLKEFAVAFIFMAFATSLPELMVGINAAFHKTSILSLGDITGTNIANLTLILGAIVIIGRGIKVNRKMVKQDSLYTSIMMVIPLILLLNGEISRIDGVLLIVSFFTYLSILLRQGKRHWKVITNGFKSSTGLGLAIKNLGLFFISIAVLLASSYFIVEAASALALKLNIPLFIIGLFLVALGTSLPEFVFGTKAVLLGREKLVLGNLMGSIVVNATFILGLVAIISPIEISTLAPVNLGIIFTLLTVLAFFIFIRTDRRISRLEGGLLILIYIIFIILETVHFPE